MFLSASIFFLLTVFWFEIVKKILNLEILDFYFDFYFNPKLGSLQLVLSFGASVIIEHVEVLV